MINFKFQKVDKEDPRMQEIFKLRYQVYCTECGFESYEDHPEEQESDEYDQYSCHFCATVAETGRVIGTVRIILPSPVGFPLERHCRLDPGRPVIDTTRVAEVSRLAISKEFRRREIDKALYSQKGIDLSAVMQVHHERRRFESLIVAGLYQCVIYESRKRELTHWYAVMVKGLWCLLRRWGFFWVPIGPEVEYHGLRGPYVISIAEAEQRMNPQLLAKPTGWED